MNYNYCMGTHPDMPNETANARGRKYHITLDNKLTLCKNICTTLIGAKKDIWSESGVRISDLMWHPAAHGQGMCGNCRNIARQKNISIKDMEY